MEPTDQAQATTAADAAGAQTGASQASQQDHATGAQQTRSTGFEGSHKQQTDVNAEEQTAVAGVHRGQLSLNAQQKLDEIYLADFQARLAAEREHRAVVLADEREHKAALRAVTLDRLAGVNAAGRRGDDNMLNVDEQGAYAAAVAAAVAKELNRG